MLIGITANTALIYDVVGKRRMFFERVYDLFGSLFLRPKSTVCTVWATFALFRRQLFRKYDVRPFVGIFLRRLRLKSRSSLLVTARAC